MQKGIVISNISDLYKVEVNNEVYDCNARGKFKAGEMSPVAGDIVEIEITDEAKRAGVINKIEEKSKNKIKIEKAKKYEFSFGKITMMCVFTCCKF